MYGCLMIAIMVPNVIIVALVTKVVFPKALKDSLEIQGMPPKIVDGPSESTQNSSHN